VIYKDGEEEGEIIPAKDAAGSTAAHKIGGFFAENRHFIDCIKANK
jgi:hypothetical protein